MNDYHTILVIGNGYDLARGLPTSFNDFFLYWKENSQEDNLFMKLLYLCFYSDKETQNEYKNNLNLSPEHNWMDVELLINHFVLESPLYNDFKTMFERHLKNLDPYPAYLWLYRIFDKKEYECVKDFQGIVISELTSLSNLLANYLKVAIQRRGVILNNRVKNILFSEENRPFKCFNFNYICPYDELKDDEIIYVHNFIYDNHIIIGIDPTQNHDYKTNKINWEKIGMLKIMTKTYQKLIDSNVYNHDINNLPDNVKKIIFYGHSLGEQDYSYFQSLFDLYNLYDGDLILEFCYSEYEKNKPPYYAETNAELLRQTERVYKLINEYGETLDNKDHGKNLLTKLLIEDRIIFRRI